MKFNPSFRFRGFIFLPLCGFVFLGMFAACNQQESNAYTVSGTLQNTTATAVYLEENALEATQPVIVDSAKIGSGGAYTLSTVPKEETIYSLRLAGTRYPFVSFVNDSKGIGINADFKNTANPYNITGSEGSAALKTFLFDLGTKINALKDVRYTGDSIGFKRSQRDSIIQSVTSLRSAAVAGVKTEASNFIARAKSAPLVLYAMGSYQSIASNPAFAIEPFTDAEVSTIIGNAAKQFPQNKALASIQQQVTAQAPLSSTAPNFALPDTAGTAVSLQSFRGKYVLVDFWASWCPPCRAENPNVVAAYRRFKDKNFTVLGVSLDKEKAPWLKAIAQDSLAWTHVSDLKFWESAVVPLYQIEEIPFNVLIDPKGTIVAQNLRGVELQQKLDSLLH